MGTVPHPEGFHFYRELGDPLGTVSLSLSDFAETVRMVDTRSVNFHVKRQDFERWIRGVIGDAELSTRLGKIRRGTPRENLRKAIIQIVNRRLNELKKMLP